MDRCITAEKTTDWLFTVRTTIDSNTHNKIYVIEQWFESSNPEKLGEYMKANTRKFNSNDFSEKHVRKMLLSMAGKGELLEEAMYALDHM